MQSNVLLRIGFILIISVVIFLVVWNMFSSSASPTMRVLSSYNMSSGSSLCYLYYSKAMSIDLEIEINLEELINVETTNISFKVLLLNQTAIEFLSTAGEIGIAELEEYGQSYTFHDSKKISIDIPSDVFAIVLHNPNSFGICVTLTQKSCRLQPPNIAPILTFLTLGFLFILVSIYYTLNARCQLKRDTRRE